VNIVSIILGKQPMNESEIMKTIPDVTGPRGVRRALRQAEKFSHATVVKVADALERQVKTQSFPERKQEAAIKAIRRARLASIR